MLYFPRSRSSDRTPIWRKRRNQAKFLRAHPCGRPLRSAEKEEILHPSEVRYRSLFDNNFDAIFTVGTKGRFLTANPAAVTLSGYLLEELQSMTFVDLCVPEFLPAVLASFQASLLGQQPGIEAAFFTKKRERVDVFVTGLRVEGAQGIEGVFCIARDITLQKRAELKRSITLEFLGLVNSCSSTLALTRKCAELFESCSGCDAVGIRLREGDDFPYFQARGFVPECVLSAEERCNCDPNGSLQSNAWNCLCGRVLRERHDLAGAFTEYGSFWTGDLPQLVASSSQFQTLPMEGDCLNNGFQSLALIPLGKRGERLGLLQFSSRNKNHFSAEWIGFWEQMADELSIALAKFQIEEALKKSNEELECRVLNRTRELQIANRTLIESQELFHQMAENVGEVFWLAAINLSKVYYASPAYEKIMGRSLQELRGNPRAWLEAVHPEDRVQAERAFRSIAQKNIPGSTEYRIIRPDGSVIWVADQGFPVRDEKGQVYRIAGIARDITSRKQAETEIRRANNALLILKGCDEALARAASEPELLDRICQIILGIEGMKMVWVGYAEDDRDKTVQPVAKAGDVGAYLEEVNFSWANNPVLGPDPIGTAIRTQGVAVCRDLEADNRPDSRQIARRKQGFASKLCLPLVWGGRCIGVLAIYSALRDAFNEQEIDLLTRLAADLSHGIHALRARVERAELQEELLKISDYEKQSIAQELHDGLCQHLVATAMMGNLLSRKLAARNDPEAEQARQISDLLNMGANEARSLAHGLHPVKPEPEGLEMALAGLAQMVSKLFHVTCKFVCDHPVPIEDRNVASNLFRMAQEAANNAMKHGRASEVIISLSEANQVILLTIRDNGIGIPLNSSPKGGMGLKIMRYRAEAIGASLEINGAAKEGTLVSCKVRRPCPANSAVC